MEAFSLCISQSLVKIIFLLKIKHYRYIYGARIISHFKSIKEQFHKINVLLHPWPVDHRDSRMILYDRSLINLKWLIIYPLVSVVLLVKNAIWFLGSLRTRLQFCWGYFSTFFSQSLVQIIT